MATVSIPSTLIQANTLVTSGQTTVAGTINQATVTLVDTNNQWGATIDTTRHLKQWGIQLDRGDGAGFVWWLFQGHPTDQALWLPFGSRDRTGGMPALALSSGAILEAAGAQVRLAILTDAQVRLGASIVTS